jgi:branched-chain amino acid transport system ATP-binding protein
MMKPIERSSMSVLVEPPIDNSQLLEVHDLKVKYGKIEAIHGIDLKVKYGEIVTIIGANGSGKSSTLLAISGVQRATTGIIRFAGKEIQRSPCHVITAMGIAHVPEGRRIFPGMTVMENLYMGTYARGDSPTATDLSHVFELFPILKDRVRQLGGTLSGGEQQMLAMGRALVSRPKLLLLDEPSMGLAPVLVNRIFELITEIRSSGVTILLVEQNARMALKIAQRAYVLETGLITLEDDAVNLLRNDAVRAAYLGG